MSPQKRMKVLFDSSFLFTPLQFHVDIFKEIENILNRSFNPIILSVTRDELLKIAEKRPMKLRRSAALALKLAEQCKQLDVKRGDRESHDDVIVRVAAELQCCVATNDRVLRKRLRHISVPVIYLRQKTRLAVDGVIS